MLVLIEKSKHGQVSEYPADRLEKITVRPGAVYTIQDTDTGKPPDDLVIKRDGKSLNVEVEGEQVVRIDDFFSEESGETLFSADGTFDPPEEMRIPSSLETGVAEASSPTAQIGEYVVWEADGAGHSLGWTAGLLGLVGGGAAIAAGAGSSSGGSLVSYSLIITAAAGPFTADVRVEVYDKNGNMLESSTHNFGQNSLQVSLTTGYTGPIFVKVIDTNDGTGTTPDYRNETGEAMDLSGDLRAMAMADGTGDVLVTVSPLTELAVRSAGVDETSFSEESLAYNNYVAQAFGLEDIVSTTPVTTITSDGKANPDFDGSDGLDAGETYGKVLAQLSAAEDLDQTITTLAQNLDVDEENGTADFTPEGEALVDEAADKYEEKREEYLDQTGEDLPSFDSDTADTTAPVITDVTIPDTAMKAGDLVTVTITVQDDAGDTYTNLSGTVGGFDLGSLTRVNSTTYTAQFTVDGSGTHISAGDDIPVNLTLDDSTGNTSANYTTAISQGNDPIDLSPPVISGVTIPDAAMAVGDIVTATITVDSDTDTYSTVTGTIGGFSLSNLTKVSDTEYTAQFTITQGGTDVAAGDSVPVNLTVTDSAGNESTSYTTAIAQGSDPIDANGPEITAVSMPASAMKVGDTVTVTITVDDDGGVAHTGISGTVGGFSLSNLSRNSSTEYTAQFTVTDNGTDVAAGSDIPVDITMTDSNGSTGQNFTDAVSQAGDPIDANSPVITAVSIPDTAMNIGDTVTVTITVEDDGGDTYTNLSGTVGGFALGALTRVDSTTYTAGFTVTQGGTDVAAGSDIPVSLTLDDTAGNTSSTYNTAISQNSDPIDANKPVISGVTIANSAMIVGQTVVVTISVADDGGDTYTGLSGTVAGYALSNLTRSDSTTYTAELTISEGDSDVLAGANHAVNLTIQDSAGNTSDAYTTAIAQNADLIDANSPNITGVSIPDAAMNVNDTVTVTITVDSDTDTYTNLSGTVAGFALSNLNKINNTTYEAEFTVTDGGTDLAAGDAVPVNITLDDSAGNTSNTYNTAISQGSDSIDANRPTLDSTTPADDATGVGANDNLTLTFSEAVYQGASGNLTIKVSSDDSTFEQIAVTDAKISGWGTATLTVNPSGTFADNTTYYVVFDEDAIVDTNGSSAAELSDKTVWNFSTPDNTAPLIASFTSTTADGSYKQGDTINIVATLNEDIQNGSQMTVTLDTGDTVTLTAATDGTTLTGTYTVGVGDTSADLTVSGFTTGTVQDLAGNALTDTSLPATNISTGSTIVIDTSTPATPSLSLASDSGSNNSDFITNDNTVNVTGLEGGTTTWAYSLDNGSTWNTGSGTSFELTNDTTFSAGYIQVRQTDAAGNVSGTGSIASQVTTDNSTPATPSPSLASDSGSSNSDFITNDNTVNVTGLEGGTTTWEYSLNNGSTWNTGSGTSFELTNDTTFSAGHIQVRQTDAAGNASSTGSIASQVTTINTAPTVQSFSSTTADGSYKTGDTVNITATVDADVQSGSDITVTLDTGDQVVLTAASDGTSLTGTYTVGAGDTSSDLTVSSFTIGTVSDLAGNSMTDTTVPTGADNIAGSHAIVIDTTSPSVSGVAISSATGVANNTLNPGDVVSVTVSMDEATTVDTGGGTPYLNLNIGGSAVQAAYTSGSGTTDLVFAYTIQSGQTDANGISIDANSLNLNGGTLADAVGNNADITHSSVADNASYMVDTTAPAINSASSATAINENSGSGQMIYDTATTEGDTGITYSLVGSDDDADFSINSGNGQVTLTGDPDYETKSSYTFTVRATDNAGNTDDQVVTLAINDVAESREVEITANAQTPDSVYGSSFFTGGTEIVKLSDKGLRGINLSGFGAEDVLKVSISGFNITSKGTGDNWNNHSGMGQNFSFSSSASANFSYCTGFTTFVTSTSSAKIVSNLPTGLTINNFGFY